MTGVPGTVQLGQIIRPCCTVNTTEAGGSFQVRFRLGDAISQQTAVHENLDGSFTHSTTVVIRWVHDVILKTSDSTDFL